MAIGYKGHLFRALNPAYARDPFSGRGAELYGGRFNAKGTPALYCSLSATTALREAHQVGNLQPTTLVSYEAEIEDVFDSRDDAALHVLGIDAAALADATWRDQMRTAGEAQTQRFAGRLIAHGHCGLVVRSFAPGTSDRDMNLVLWRWGATAPARLRLMDDEGRLSRSEKKRPGRPSNDGTTAHRVAEDRRDALDLRHNSPGRHDGKQTKGVSTRVIARTESPTQRSPCR